MQNDSIVRRQILCEWPEKDFPIFRIVETHLELISLKNSLRYGNIVSVVWIL